jgi:hypothetical protein
MDDAVSRLSIDSGVLHRILGRKQLAGYDLLELTFDHGSLRLACDADTDEIVVTVREKDSDDELPEIVEDAALESLRGKVIETTWSLSNHLSFSDAFQLRCLDLDTRQAACCQFEVAAAAITVARVL